MKNIKTTPATTHNKHTSTDREATPTRRPPPFQPTAQTHPTPPPHLLITVPPPRIDLDALKASILEGLTRDTAALRKTMPTTQPMPTTQSTITTPANTETTANTVPLQRIDFDALRASILEGLTRDTAALRKTMPTTQPMPTTTTMPTTQLTITTPANAETTANTVPPQRIDFDALKASILEGLTRDTAALRKTMPTTQPMSTTQPTTTTPANTETTDNTLPNDPARSTVNAPTLPKPQPSTQTTIDAADADEDDFQTMIPMIPTTMMQPPMPKAPYNATTEKTKTSNNPATDSTFHQPQLLMQLTADDEELIGDDFQTQLPMMTTTKQTTNNTKTTEKPLIGDPLQPQQPQLLTQPTAAISDDAEDDIMMTLRTTMPPKMILATLNTPTTETTTLDNAPDTQYTLNRQLSKQFTGDSVHDAEDAQPMTPTTIPTTANDERTLKTKLCPPPPIHYHRLHPQKPTTNATVQCRI